MSNQVAQDMSTSSPFIFSLATKALIALITTSLLHNAAYAVEPAHDAASTTPPAIAKTAKPAAAISLENLFKSPQFGGANLSPDGKNLAVTTSINGRLQLAVVDLDTKAVTPVAGFDDADIASTHWVNNDRLVFDLIDRDSEKYSTWHDGLFAVNRDGSKLIELMATHRKQIDQIEMGNRNSGAFKTYLRHLYYIGSYGDGSNDILVEEGNGRDDETSAYKVNSLTVHKKQFLFKVKGIPTGFVADNNQLVRVVTSRGDGDKTEIISYRDDASDNWKELAEVSTIDPKFSVIGFDSDNKTMYVSARNGEDKAAIYQYDFANNKLGAKIASDKEVDVDGVRDLVTDKNTHKVLGIRIYSEPPKTQWLDEKYAAAQKTLDASFPDKVNVIFAGDINARVVVFSYSSTDPGKYSLFDPAKKKLEPLFSSMPQINPGEMADQLIFDYVARDGLHIPSYLTIPKGREMKSLPLVVYVHGGPWTRDYFGFDPTVQFLASRGYAVFQPEFRGSSGYGWNHFTKGWKAWGLSMQDDVTDGVKDLAKQGVIDPARVCIMGASYGGYATLMGLVKDPDQYKCGIDLLGVSDINLMFTTGLWRRSDEVKYGFTALIGDRDKMRDQFTATSPVKQAQKITAPVFMAYGEFDQRVPLIHGEGMRDALKKNGNTYEWMVLEKEEHGFTKMETRLKLFSAIEKFLNKYNPADPVSVAK